MRALEDILHDDLQYSIAHIKKPELERTAIEGTAKFEGLMKGSKSYSKRSILKVIVGIILFLLGIGAMLLSYYNFSYVIFGFIFLIVGIILLAKSKSLVSIIIHIKMEGESYKAGAGKESDKEKDKDKTERIGVISDTRVTVYGTVEGSYGDKEIRLRDLNMDSLIKKVEKELIPRFELPKIG